MTSHFINICKFVTSRNDYIAFQKYSNSIIETKFQNSQQIPRLNSNSCLTPPPPKVIYINGYNSEMQTSKKVAYITKFCENFGIDLLTFDHYAHGLSTGSFLKATVGRWYKDLCLLIEKKTSGPQLLIGSSMGTWLALLVVLKNKNLRNRIHGIIGIAPAINFTEIILNEILELNNDKLNDQNDHKNNESILFGTRTIQNETHNESQIVYNRPSKYSPTGYYPMTLHFLQESREHFINQQELVNGIPCPIVLIHGQQDQDISYQETLKWSKLLSGKNEENVKIKLISDGDHRLSREQDLKILGNEIENMCFGY
ncbi:10476_t:CDS:1 [Diversispora eburnea]|uniref:10476_t:CDS:1 n=1 Tax=Diversispora eburnea TaxID=1213867 RepID=A0A9N8VPU5_9GLOM|nr:10476_t:CDS:1 [Diversispora eburnea]